MEFDQLIFQRLFRFFNKNRKVDPAVVARTVDLNDIKSKLTIIARALSGRAIDIYAATRDGGWQNNNYYLPGSFSLMDSAEENIQFYVFRVCYLHIQQKLNYNWETGSNFTLEESETKAVETSPQVLSILFEEFPILQEVHTSIKDKIDSSFTLTKKELTPDYTLLYGHWMKNKKAKSADDLKHISELKKALKEIRPTTEIEAKAADEVETIQVDKKAQEDYTLSHHFEKVDTAEEFNGIWRDFDGDDTLKEDEEALSELNLKHTVRVDDTVHSVYKAELASNLNIAESTESDFKGYYLSYPEWNFSDRKYKLDYCKVFPNIVKEVDKNYYTNTLKTNARILRFLRKRFASMDNALEVVRRQSSGEEFDFDAVIDMYSDIKAKHTPDEKIYLSKRKRKKDLAITFLLDLSLSADSYTNGNRILDVEKQVVILLGEVLNENDVEFEIAGFSSKTRNLCTYNSIKSFDEPWNTGKYHIGAVQSSGYTRIGPALRHAGSRLMKQEANKKWLVLLSDGKPNDYDKYEGKYGIQDVKQALRELNAMNINTYAVAIEDQARYYLPQMFGQNHYNILSSPLEMVESLTKLYERIEKS